MKHGSTRLASYVCLAAGPAVATSSVVADAVPPVTATAYNPGAPDWVSQKVNAFTTYGIHFQAFAMNDAAAYGSGMAIFQIDPADRGGSVGNVRFYLSGSSPRLINGYLGNDSLADSVNPGYAGFSSWGNGPVGLLSANSSGYLGFSVCYNANNGADGWINGFIQYSITATADTYAFTILSWTVRDDDPVIMPAGAPAVPGLGGLAALACGAAGVRRKRTRVA